MLKIAFMVKFWWLIWILHFCDCRFEDRPCVLKEFDLEDSKEMKSFLNEAKKLEQCAHQNVVPLEGLFTQKGSREKTSG